MPTFRGDITYGSLLLAKIITLLLKYDPDQTYSGEHNTKIKNDIAAIGKEINETGGMEAMQSCFYGAKGYFTLLGPDSPAPIVEAAFDGIGEWRS